MSYFKSILTKITALILLSFLTCCTSSNSSEYNQRFEKYLNTEFGFSLPEQSLEFLVVPGQGCSHSSNELVNMFSEFSPDIENLYLVVNPSFYSNNESEANNPKVLIDRQGKLARLDLGYSSPMYILSNTGDIQSISEVSIYNLDSLKEALRSSIYDGVR